MNTVYYSFVTETDKAQTKKLCSLRAEDMITEIAKRIFNVPRGELEFLSGEHGKPYLKGYPNFHFGISHSGNLVTVAVADGAVGIDCEKIRKINLKTADRHFTEAERNYVNSAPFEAEMRFFEIWTAKEAYLKKIGTGLKFPLNAVDTLSKSFFTAELNGYIITVCTDGSADFGLAEYGINDFVS